MIFAQQFIFIPHHQLLPYANKQYAQCSPKTHFSYIQRHDICLVDQRDSSVKQRDDTVLWLAFGFCSGIPFHIRNGLKGSTQIKAMFYFFFPPQTYVTELSTDDVPYLFICQIILYSKNKSEKKPNPFVLIYLVPVSSTPFICCPALQMRSGLTNARWCQRHARRANIAVENKICGWD